MIALNAVSFAYADMPECLLNINLHVRSGECIVLTGRSGNGKTTITRIINGLAPSYYEGRLCGEVLIDGRLSQEMSQWEKGETVGSVFQDPASQFFSGELKGEVAFACENYGYDTDKIRARTDETIKKMGLCSLIHQNLDTLSSGEKQKVAIASVHAVSPRVLVFDEPSANLDEESAFQLADIMRALKTEGHTLIVSEHRLSYLMGIADRFIYLENGTLSRTFTPVEMSVFQSAECRKMGLRSALPVKRPNLSVPTGGDAPPLELRDIGYAIKGKSILHSISFCAGKGQCVAITGKNGAGKSTLAQVMCGLARESHGECLIHGKRMRPGKRLSHVWYSANDTNTQFFTASVEEELLLLCDRNEETLNCARSLLQKLGLYEHKSRHPATLSGGQKQRLSIACGLFSNRDILIFDEPTSGLDGENLYIVSDMMKDAAKNGKTVFVITHDNELIKSCCTHMVVIP